MSRAADDKRAFAQIMAEISDSDDDIPTSRGNSTTTKQVVVKSAQPSEYTSYHNQSTNRPQQNSSQAFQKSTHFDREVYESSQPKSTSQMAGANFTYKMSKDEKDIENFGVQRGNLQPAPINAANASQQAPSKSASSFLLRAASFKSASTGGDTHSSSSSSSGANTEINPEHIISAKRWLTRTCTRDDPPMQCYIERERSGFGLVHQIYRCYLEPSEGHGPRFLMAAKKRSSSKTSYYLISLDTDPDDRGSEAVLGKLRGNAVGSQYLITDSGLAPEKAVAPSMLRKVLHDN